MATDGEVDGPTVYAAVIDVPATNRSSRRTALHSCGAGRQTGASLRPRGRPCVAALISTLIALGNVSCSSERSAQPWTAEEIGPSNRDYPRPNAHPSRTVEISGQRPDALELRFIARFGAENRTSRCESTVGIGVYARYLVSIEIPITLIPGGYRATLVPDYFEPGYCDWRLAGVVPWADGGIREESQHKGESVGHIEIAPDNARLVNSLGATVDEAQQAYVWCTNSGSEDPSKPAPLCMDFTGAQTFLPGKHPPPVNPLADHSRPRGNVELYPETRRLQINFIDLDADAEPAAR